MGSISNVLGSLTSPFSAGVSAANSNSKSGSNSSSSSSSGSGSSSDSSSNPTNIFMGTSAYSKDFQNVVNRAVAIASLPIGLLVNQATALNDQATELGTIDGLFAKLQTAVQGIDDAMRGASYRTEYSNPDVVDATLSDGATEGVYAIDVADIGAHAASISAQAWEATAGPGGGGSPYVLVVGDQRFTFTPADNSAQTVASTINAKYGDKVHATAVNMGSGSNPSYRVSLQSVTLGPLNLGIEKAGTTATSLQQQGSYDVSQTAQTWNDNPGSSAAYTLVADGTTYQLTTTGHTAQNLADAINSQAGAQANVYASVVDLGTSAQHDYRLVLQSTVSSSTPRSLQLEDSAENGGAGLQQAGTAATSLTRNAWNPSAGGSSGNLAVYNLVIGSSTYSFSPADNRASTVASTINDEFANEVHASIVNLGTSDAPQYHIALQYLGSGTAPAMDIERTDAIGYQKQQTAGKLAQYAVDGGPTVTSDTRTVTISDGITFTLQGTGATDATVSRSTSALDAALSSFTDAYNAAFDELAKHRGQAGGSLQGEPILNILSQTLNNITSYLGSSAHVNGLASLGVTFDQSCNGHLDYNRMTLLSADVGYSGEVQSFLGSATAGGFLKLTTDALNNLENSTSGILKTTEKTMQTQINGVVSQISAKQTQVDQLQANLIRQMAAADAAIASREQQYAALVSMFQAQQTASQQYGNG